MEQEFLAVDSNITKHLSRKNKKKIEDTPNKKYLRFFKPKSILFILFYSLQYPVHFY